MSTGDLVQVLYRLFAIPFFIAVTHSAQAGPWLREQGKTFTSSAAILSYNLETTSQTYIEYGLTDAMTVIGNLGTSRLATGSNKGFFTASIRRALTKPDAASKWAYELGVGISWADTTTQNHLRTAVTWGKGMEWGAKTGWMTVEAAGIWDVSKAQHMGKLDATIGLKFTEVTSGMMQVYTTFSAQSSTATLAPSLIFQPRNSKFRIQLGTESRVGDLENSALKFGLWREF